ncbi:MAG: hypothetical protein HZB16_12485, partial [Armatimonadetes bacterium]|nr:hypothetical protein [Armatimonadota bacterium]
VCGLAMAAEPPRWQPLGEPGCGGWMTSITINPHDTRQVLLGGDMLGIGRSENRGDRWQPTFGLRSYEVGDCTWHPTDTNIVWAGTVSGPYLSTDGGRTWSERRSGMPPVADGQYTVPIEKVLFDPADARRLLAFGGSSRGWEARGARWGTVWESTDAGTTWGLLATLPAEGKGGNIVGAAWDADGKRLYAAVRGAGIVASDDRGHNWTPRCQGLTNLNVERVITHPSEPRTLWCCATAAKVDGAKEWHAGGLYKSADAGVTWQQMTGGLPNKRGDQEFMTTGFKGFAVSRTNPRRMVACNAPWDANWLFVTDDGGQSWRRVADKSTVDVAYFAGLNLTVMAIDPANPDVLYGAGSEYAIRSLDGGKTWTDTTSEQVAGRWRGRGYSGLCCEDVVFDPWVRGRVFLNAMDAGKLWESRDNGSTWTYRGSDPWPWGGGNGTSLAKDGRGYCATGQFGGNGGILRTVDGTAWKSLSGAEHGLPGKDGQGVAESVYTLPDDSSKVWCCWGGRLYASVDGGERFALVDGVRDVHSLAADPGRPSRIFVSGGGDCYLTDDGAAWKAIGGPKWAGLATADSLGRFYVGAWRSDKRAGLWRYANGVWTRLWDNYYVRRVAVDPSNPRRMVAVDMDHPYHDHVKAQGVWLSTDDGQSWTKANDGLPGLRVQAVGINPHDPEDIIVGTHGLGFYRARWAKDYAPKGEVGYTATADDRAFAAPLPPVKQSPIAVRNGDMSAGTDKPTGWDSAWGAAKAFRDTAVYHSGPASLRVETGGGSGQAFQMFEGNYAGAKVKVSGWLKSAGQVKAQAALQAFAAGFAQNEFKQLRFVQGASDWQRFEATVDLPAWTAQFNIQLMVDGPGQAWLDDVTAETVAAGAEAPTPDKLPRVAWEPHEGYFRDYPQAWRAMHAGFLEQARKGGIDLLFLGDSLTQGWDKALWAERFEPRHAANFGIGGDRTDQILWRIANGELDGLSPKLVVLMIGVNNIWPGDKDVDIARGREAIVKALRARLPATKLLLLAALPAIDDHENGLRGTLKRANALSASLADDQSVFWLDLLGPAGYRVLADGLEPVVARWCK